MKFTATLFIPIFTLVGMSTAQATFRARLNCQGSFAGDLIQVTADPLIDYHNTNLTVSVDTAKITYYGLINNNRRDSLRVMGTLTNNVFSISAESFSDHSSTVLYALPGTIQTETNSSGLVKFAKFKAIMRGRDPRLVETNRSRDFYTPQETDFFKAYDVNLDCTYGGNE